ncbi:MAG: hypothetical protein AMXMBFR13_00920 [Phycisphaerae bacterium]
MKLLTSLLSCCLSVALASSALADTVASEMLSRGFSIVADEVGVSGLKSSYHGLPMSNGAYGALPTFGPGRVSYPGVGAVPSPGGNLGRPFDQGVLGYRVQGGNLTLAVAGGIDPRSWIPASGYGNTLFGPGDLFLEVLQNDVVKHYALLNDMNGNHSLNNATYNTAQSFRYGSGPAVGELVLLDEQSDVQLTGGPGSYQRGSNSPAGLDERVFAKGGEEMNVGTLSHYGFSADQPLGSGGSMNWFVSEWSVPLSIFGPGALEIALHMTATCGNDQIGGLISIPSITQVPAPGAALLAMGGLSLVGWIRRRIA